MKVAWPTRRVKARRKGAYRKAVERWLGGPTASLSRSERSNDDALVGVILHKRHGKADPSEQWVTMTMRDFVALLTGTRPELGSS